MTPEQTRAQHLAQRDMVVRSLLLAPSPEERSEERRRHPRKPSPAAREFRVPTVNEVRYL